MLSRRRRLAGVAGGFVDMGSTLVVLLSMKQGEAPGDEVLRFIGPRLRSSLMAPSTPLGSASATPSVGLTVARGE